MAALRGRVGGVASPRSSPWRYSDRVEAGGTAAAEPVEGGDILGDYLGRPSQKRVGVVCVCVGDGT